MPVLLFHAVPGRRDAGGPGGRFRPVASDLSPQPSLTRVAYPLLNAV